MHASELFKLDGKVAVITGTSSPKGIGGAVAGAFAEMGCNVVISDIRDSVPLAEEITKKTGVKVIGTYCDVTSFESIQNMVDLTLKEFGHIDILVNNAGTSYPYNINTIDMDFDKHWQRIMDVNLNGTVRTTQIVARHMVKEKIKGSIINTASNFGVRPTAPQGGHAYPVSKAAIIMLTKAWAGEFARKGIRVNAVAPGFLDTDITWMWQQTPDSLAWINTKIPTGGMRPADDIRGAYLYLASDASSYATGSVIVVDGGMAAVLFYDEQLMPETP